MMMSVFGGFWKRPHLDVDLCFSFIEVKWGRRETSFYPSHTVKTRAGVVDGGWQRHGVSLDSRDSTLF